MSPRLRVGMVSGVVPFTATTPATLVSKKPCAITSWRHLGMPPTGLVAEEIPRRRVVAPTEIGLFEALGYLLTAPLTIPAKGLEVIAREVEAQAREEADIETRLGRELLKNRMRYESGEISEEEYRKREAELKRRLEEIIK